MVQLYLIHACWSRRNCQPVPECFP
jgi:hypothetical protein